MRGLGIPKSPGQQCGLFAGTPLYKPFTRRGTSDIMAVVEIVLFGRMLGVETRSIYHINSVLDTDDDANDAIGFLQNTYDAHLMPGLSDEFTLYGATKRNISVAGSPAIPGDWIATTGDVTTEPLPLQTQGIITWRSNTPVPNASRKYICGLTESNNGPTGHPDPAFLTGMQTFAQAFVTHNEGVGGADFQWVCVKKDPVTGLALAANPWSLAIARDYWAVLKRRRS